MKKTLIFFIGFLLLILSFGMMYFASTLLTASNTSEINSVIFQPNNLSVNRTKKPISANQLGDSIQEQLIKKYISEYFYIIPDSENLASRTLGDSIMAALSSPKVFSQWKKNKVPKMIEMAEKKMLQKIIIENEILKKGDYFEVHYELKTWEKPNIISENPKTEKGIIYLKTRFEKGLRDTRSGANFDVQKYIKNGGDPAALFKFMVMEIKI